MKGLTIGWQWRIAKSKAEFNFREKRGCEPIMIYSEKSAKGLSLKEYNLHVATCHNDPQMVLIILQRKDDGTVFECVPIFVYEEIKKSHRCNLEAIWAQLDNILVNQGQPITHRSRESDAHQRQKARTKRLARLNNESSSDSDEVSYKDNINIKRKSVKNRRRQV
jgi:hypothetical protein